MNSHVLITQLHWFILKMYIFVPEMCLPLAFLVLLIKRKFRSQLQNVLSEILLEAVVSEDPH